MELGVITPQQGLTVFNTGRFPQAEEIAPAQAAFVSDREKGYYNPIVGGVPVVASAEGETNQTPKSAGRPEGAITEANFSRKNIQEIIYKIEALDSFTKAKAKENLGIKKLSKQQNSAIEELCKKIVCAHDLDNWEANALECVKDFSKIESLGLLDEVSEIAESHQLDFYSAAILHHSKHYES